MKEKHLKKRNCYFTALKGLSKKDKKEYLKECPKILINVLCEGCFNLLKHEKLKNKKDIQNKIKPIKEQFEKLADANFSIKDKRQILDKIGVEVISLINKHIVPLLDNLVEK